MLEQLFDELYQKFKLNFYKNMFRGLQEREASLTATETFAVEVIHALKRPTVNELASFLEMSQPNITYKIGSLVKKGYVRKVQSEEDKREVFLEVTERFHKYYDMKNEYIGKVLSRLFDRISEQRLEDFENILRLMSRELMPEVSEYIREEESQRD